MTPQGMPRLAVLAVLLLAGMAAAGALGQRASAQSADSSLDFPENGTGPVGTFVAHDQDGDAIEWSLGGPDRDLFTIDGGVLAFRAAPDHEDPRSAQAGNVYRVAVEAGGGTHDVTVTVTDVDEPGAVGISRLQPQVSRPLGAALSDEDEGVSAERWQWARSEDRRNWTDIPGATTPHRSPERADEGRYLRATVTYTDRFGPGKTASAVTAYRVEARTLSNAAPSFAGPGGRGVTTLARSVPENSAAGSAVGRPVTATDADQDILFYELLDTPDLEDGGGEARFTMDSGSGRIRVGKVLGADPDEREDEDSPDLTEDGDAGDAGNGRYVLRVRVSDPSTASATVNVIVTVTDVNEPPEFSGDAPTLLKVRENADPPEITLGDGRTPVDADTFAAADPDGADTVTGYSVTGRDGEVFEFDQAGILSLREGHEPDHEEMSSYSITITVHSGHGARRRSAALDVTIEVVDTEDPGEVWLSQREPQEGRGVHAAVSDPDGGVRIGRWVWERSAAVTVEGDGSPSAGCRADPESPLPVIGGWIPIDAADSSAYTPEPADVGRCLRVTATYTDGMGDAAEEARGVAEAPVQAASPVNTAPRFVDRSGRTSRRVAENTGPGRSIGPPVTAFDDDGDLLVYTLGGADAAFFGVSRSNGQLLTKAPLDYESRTRYAVRMIATDPSGASASLQVTVNVTDEDDPARITGRGSIAFPENAATPVGTFGAAGQVAAAMTWSVSGPDADRFTIDGGRLRFREPPDYERPRSALAGNVYRVTVRAGGGSRDVTVTVTNADEAGMVSIDRPQPQAGRPLTASLTDDDEGVSAERWQWARSRDGRTWTDIEGAISPGRSPAPDDVGMYLRATVTYADGFGPGKTASAVSANRVEPTTLFNAAPSLAGQDDDGDTPYIEVSRTVAENAAAGTPVGAPVAATDADEDLLFYELVDTPDLRDGDGDPRFVIDGLTGQITVGRVLGADDGEREDEDSRDLGGEPALPGGEDAGDPDNSEYVLRVRASDPSTASATVNVIVTVTNVNEPPAFGEDAPTLLRVRENASPPVITTGDGGATLALRAYAATDQDDADTALRYTVTGADGEFFTVDGEGTLRFRTGHRPDFEDQSSYSIAITARSGDGTRRLTASLDVTVEVVDAEDPGEVDLSQRQPEVGIAIHATVTDEDGGVAIGRWLWERSDEVTFGRAGLPSAECEDDAQTPGIQAVEGWDPIGGVSSAVYVPRPTDFGRCLRATAIYSDNTGDERRATGVSEVPVGRHGYEGVPEPEDGFVNAAPAFPDQDHLTGGDQSDETGRTVPENTKAGQSIGSPVSAIDEDDDLLIYTLGGEDAALFRIVRNSGQLRTRAPLDYEARSTYTVVVTATDPFGASDSIVVTISVTDQDDPAKITVISR